MNRFYDIFLKLLDNTVLPQQWEYIFLENLGHRKSSNNKISLWILRYNYGFDINLNINFNNPKRISTSVVKKYKIFKKYFGLVFWHSTGIEFVTSRSKNKIISRLLVSMHKNHTAGGFVSLQIDKTDLILGKFPKTIVICPSKGKAEIKEHKIFQLLRFTNYPSNSDTNRPFEGDGEVYIFAELCRLGYRNCFTNRKIGNELYYIVS